MSIWTRPIPASTPVPAWWSWVIIAGFVGFLCGWINNWLPLTQPRLREPIRMPALWRIPKLPGMGGLRLAMVHDVIHERFAIRSPTWYASRNAAAQARIAAWDSASGEPPAAILEAYDDLAVGLDKVGDDAAAAEAMHRKAALIHLALPDSRTPPSTESDAHAVAMRELEAVTARGDLSAADHHRYTTLANLGTALVHGGMRAALAGDAAAEARVRQGLCCLDQAVAINPAAHFGRESWQIVAVEHLLATRAHPDLLLSHDLIGDRLPTDDAPVTGSPYSGSVSVFNWPDMYVDHAVPDDPAVIKRLTQTNNRLFGNDWTAEYVDRHITVSERNISRSTLTTVGIDTSWTGPTQSHRHAPAAFDEPLLGLLGMWTLGGGANPHSALAIATICERIGQRPLAFDAYERCAALADAFSSDPAVRRRLVEHCHARQLALARALSPGNANDWMEEERKRHADELAWALKRRAAARQSEERALAAGTAPELIPPGDGDPRPLASPPGNADERWGTTYAGNRRSDGIACALLAMAAVGWIGIAVGWLRCLWRRA